MATINIFTQLVINYSGMESVDVYLQCVCNHTLRNFIDQLREGTFSKDFAVTVAKELTDEGRMIYVRSYSVQAKKVHPLMRDLLKALGSAKGFHVREMEVFDMRPDDEPEPAAEVKGEAIEASPHGLSCRDVIEDYKAGLYDEPDCGRKEVPAGCPKTPEEAAMMDEYFSSLTDEDEEEWDCADFDLEAMAADGDWEREHAGM